MADLDPQPEPVHPSTDTYQEQFEREQFVIRLPDESWEQSYNRNMERRRKMIEYVKEVMSGWTHYYIGNYGMAITNSEADLTDAGEEMNKDLDILRRLVPGWFKDDFDYGSDDSDDDYDPSYQPKMDWWWDKEVSIKLFSSWDTYGRKKITDWRLNQKGKKYQKYIELGTGGSEPGSKPKPKPSPLEIGRRIDRIQVLAGSQPFHWNSSRSNSGRFEANGQYSQLNHYPLVISNGPHKGEVWFTNLGNHYSVSGDDEVEIIPGGAFLFGDERVVDVIELFTHWVMNPSFKGMNPDLKFNAQDKLIKAMVYQKLAYEKLIEKATDWLDFFDDRLVSAIDEYADPENTCGWINETADKVGFRTDEMVRTINDMFFKKSDDSTS